MHCGSCHANCQCDRIGHRNVLWHIALMVEKGGGGGGGRGMWIVEMGNGKWEEEIWEKENEKMRMK